MSTRPTHSEEPQLSQSHVFLARKRRVEPHHPLRILQNHGRETASLPLRRVRTDVLDDERHPLLPSPASHGGKTRPTWVFAALEVWSRLWTSTVVGRRSYRNTLALVRDVASRMTLTTCPVIVTDGFEFYGTAIRRVFGPAALYAQVIKTRRHDRVVRVERRTVIGAAWRFDEALTHSEDSSTVNTSFIERLNLTIRQSSAYLSRRTLSHARATDTLDAHLELLRCYYNFVRPHGALKFGREARTPAMQAGLATRRADPAGHLRVSAARCLVAEGRVGVR